LLPCFAGISDRIIIKMQNTQSSPAMIWIERSIVMVIGDSTMPNKSPEPTAVATAVSNWTLAYPPWLSFFR
jgi:hypothetical protein